MSNAPNTVTGFSGPLRLDKQLKSGVAHPMADVPIEVAAQMRGAVPVSTVYFFDHMTGQSSLPLAEGALGAYTLVGTTGVAVGVLEAEDYGVYRLETAALEDDNAILRQQLMTVNYSLTVDTTMAVRLSISDANDMEFYCGLTVSNADFVAGLPASGLFFSKAETATQLTFNVRESGAATTEAFGPTILDGGDVILVIKTTNGTVQAHIYDVATGIWYHSAAVLSSDANMPLVTDDLLFHCAIETGAAAAKNAQLDWLYLGKEGE